MAWYLLEKLIDNQVDSICRADARDLGFQASNCNPATGGVREVAVPECLLDWVEAAVRTMGQHAGVAG